MRRVVKGLIAAWCFFCVQAEEQDVQAEEQDVLRSLEIEHRKLQMIRRHISAAEVDDSGSIIALESNVDSRGDPVEAVHEAEGDHKVEADVHVQDVHQIVPSPVELATSPPAQAHPVDVGHPPEEAHGEEGHGHGEEGHGEGHGEAGHAVDAGSSSVLFGCLIVAMLCLYLTNFPDDEIKVASWKAIANGLAIVCALLLKDVIKDFADMIAGGESESNDDHGHGGHHEPSAEEIQMAVVLFTIFFFVMEAILLGLKKRPHALRAWGLIFAHVCSFLCADAFAIAQEAKPWNESVWASFSWVLITSVVLITLAALAHFVRQRVALRDGEMDRYEHDWLHQCEHSEDEFLAFTVGLVMTQVIRFALVGEIPNPHGVQEHDDLVDIWTLFGAAVCFGLLTFLLGMTTNSLESAWAKRAAGISIQTFSMTMSWCLLFFGKWLFWYSRSAADVSDVVSPMMAMAVIFLMFGFLAVIIIEKIRERMEHCARSFEALMDSFMLMVGLAWEVVFHESIHQFALAKATDKSMIPWYHLGLGFVISALIIPGWMMFILPKTIKEHSHGHEPGHETHSESPKEPLRVDEPKPSDGSAEQTASDAKAEESDDF